MLTNQRFIHSRLLGKIQSDNFLILLIVLLHLFILLSLWILKWKFLFNERPSCFCTSGPGSHLAIAAKDCPYYDSLKNKSLLVACWDQD